MNETEVINLLNSTSIIDTGSAGGNMTVGAVSILILFFLSIIILIFCIKGLKKLIKYLKNYKPKKKKHPKIKQISQKSFKKGLLDFKYWKTAYHKFMNPSKQMFIIMELRTGKWDMFFINARKENFSYGGGEYVIDTDAKIYISGLRMFGLIYHQDLNIPIKYKVPVSEIKKTIKAKGLILRDQSGQDLDMDIETATNPSSLKVFIESEVIKNVMQSQMIHDYLRAMRLLVIIGTCASVILLILFIAKTGMLSDAQNMLGI